MTTAENIHQPWHKLLSDNVQAVNHGHSTAVNYAAMQTQRSELTAYLKVLSAITPSEFEQFSKNEQLAFLINAYNAWTVELILTKYPKLTSIKDLGSFFSSPWSKEFIPLLGETRSLDNIEHDLIRGAVDKKGKPKYNDPRIHFAVNCASIGCPALRAEAYTGEQLDAQLQAQAKRFLADRSRNFAENNTLHLSAIFKWYGDDFAKGFNKATSLNEFLLLYRDALALSPTQQKALAENKMKIEFLSYNWDLNVQH
ncbi:MAG: DUF547 domain-containing protein [Thalassotalea sp.]